MPAVENAQTAHFELQVELDVGMDRAWKVLTEEIDRWWLPDFRATGEKCVVTLEARAGGALRQRAPDGTELDWYTVQMVVPGSALYLVGYSAKEWGGPNVSMLKLALSPHEGGTRLTVTDSLIGCVDASRVATLKEGWEHLFGAGYRDYLQGAGGRA
ncbi:MAG: hypothetical protein HKN12_04940 [Gemmatimonadetes bacterium]|nr:hypothetical protein [Gemmatimonadota bacterium]